MNLPKIGIIGGSGLYQMEGVQFLEELWIETPFGSPSDAIFHCQLDGQSLYFLPRHGRGHRFLPHEINYRANLWAFKSLGIEHIFSVSAVGSMKEELAPEHIVIPDQFFDRTYRRISSFFGEGVVAHVQLGDPVCPRLCDLLFESAKEEQAQVHRGGTYLCMEGPQFSTRGESTLYRSWGISVIGMTNVTEAKLAREAEMGYATMAMVTDYDCWHEEEVSAETVMKTIHNNVQMAQNILLRAIRKLYQNPFESPFANALENAIMTPKSAIPNETLKKLEPILKRVLSLK